MKRLVIFAFVLSTFTIFAQQKIKDSEVPKEVQLALENTYTNYKVKSWYKETSQFIADLLVDGQAGKAYFTSKGSWQYSTFPVVEKESPTLMMNYFINNYPGYRAKGIDYVEEFSGDNYYRMIISQKGIGSTEYEMIFDTRGKLLKSNAPDPEKVKKEYLALTNPEDYEALEKRTEPVAPQAGATSTATNDGKGKKEGKGKNVDIAVEVNDADKPTDAVVSLFEKRTPKSRIEKGPEWIKDNGTYIARYENKQKIASQASFTEDAQPISIMTDLEKDRYPAAILKYLNEKYKKEKFVIERVARVDFDVKYREPSGAKPKRYFYVVISQKVKGQKEKKITRMTFDQTFRFSGLLAEPIDRFDKMIKY